MLLATPARLPQRIAIFIVPKFSMMDFTAVIEAQRIANRMSGRELYSWHILSKDGRPVAASNGIAMAAEAPLERMFRDKLFELAHELRVRAERKLSIDPLLQGRQPELPEPVDRRLRKRLVREIGKRRSSP